MRQHSQQLPTAVVRSVPIPAPVGRLFPYPYARVLVGNYIVTRTVAFIVHHYSAY